MKKIIQYIKIVFFAVPVILYYHLFHICRMARNPQKYPFKYRYAIVRKYFRKVLWAYGVEYHPQSLEQFNEFKGKRLIIANHLSTADPMMCVVLSEKPLTFVAKKEAQKYPFIGKVLKVLEGFPLDRSNVMNQIGQIRHIVNFLKRDDDVDVVIFAEGTRNKHPENHCLDFHAGSLKIASMAGVSLSTISFYGSFRVFDKKHYMRRYPAWIDFGKTIPLEEFKDISSQELADRTRLFIDNRVDEFRILDKEYVYNTKLTLKRKALETIPDHTVKS